VDGRKEEGEVEGGAEEDRGQEVAARGVCSTIGPLIESISADRRKGLCPKQSARRAGTR